MSYWFDQMAHIKDRTYPEQIAYLRENHGFSRAHANALVLFSRGSTSARRFETVDDYLEPFDEVKRRTVRAIFAAIQRKHRRAELVIAWNQPMLRLDGQYIFGHSVHSQHILIAPMSSDVVSAFRPRLEGYVVNKKTIKVPVDWKVDAALLNDMVDARIAEFA